MGRFKTDYEVYSFKPESGEYNNESHLLIAFKLTMIPSDDVDYANGLFGWGTATDDAACEYVKVTSTLTDNNDGIFLLESAPITEIDTITYSYTLTLTPMAGPDGSLYFVFTPSVTKTDDVQSVEIINNSNTFDKTLDIKYTYPLSDDYAKTENVQYGYYIIRKSNFDYTLNLRTEAQFSLGKNSIWGSNFSTGASDSQSSISFN